MNDPIPIDTPTLLGTLVVFEDGEEGMITDERPCEVYIESDFYTGWVSKATFFELSGTE